MKIIILTLIFFSINLFSYHSNKRWYKIDEKKIDNIINKNKTLNFNKKILKNSNLYLNTPYKVSPLGEGKIKPLYSFKYVDCLTFIESVIALSNAKNLNNFKNILQKIRYKNGEINYNKRNHIMISQWIPNNTKLGFIKDITYNLIKDIKKIELKNIKKIITKKSYGKKFKKFLKIKNIPIGTYNINYISINDFIKYYKKINIPNGAIMTIVRKDLKEYPIMISHLGFIIKKNKLYYFRNATKSTRYQEVIDAKLMPYLRFYNRYYEKKGWPIIGLQFYMPKNQSKIYN